MGNDFFRFKQFVVFQGRAAMKVGTDGVLLGALTEGPSDGAPCRVLDIGVGTGLVSLMMAQRFETAMVVGLDIEPSAVAEAADNFASSPFWGRLRAELADAVSFRPTEVYDLVVSNPPYFAGDLQCPAEGRNFARHDVGLPIGALVATAAACLRSGGRLSVIIPDDRARLFVAEAEAHGFTLVRWTRVYTTRRKPAKRSVVQFVKSAGGAAPEGARTDELTLIGSDGRETAEYREATREFYLDEHWKE